MDSSDDAALNVASGTHPPAPSLWEGECVRSDSFGRGVIVSGVIGRADMVGSFPRVGWMIQEVEETERQRDEETEWKGLCGLGLGRGNLYLVVGVATHLCAERQRCARQGLGSGGRRH